MDGGDLLIFSRSECIKCGMPLSVTEETSSSCTNAACEKYMVVQTGVAIVGADRIYSEDMSSNNTYTKSNDEWKPETGLVEDKSGERRLKEESVVVDATVQRLFGAGPGGFTQVCEKAKQYYYLIAPRSRLRGSRLIACVYMATLRWHFPRTLDECVQAYREANKWKAEQDPTMDQIRDAIGYVIDALLPTPHELTEIEAEMKKGEDLGRARRSLNALNVPQYLIDVAEREIVPRVVDSPLSGAKRRINANTDARDLVVNGSVPSAELITAASTWTVMLVLDKLNMNLWKETVTLKRLVEAYAVRQSDVEAFSAHALKGLDTSKFQRPCASCKESMVLSADNSDRIIDFKCVSRSCELVLAQMLELREKEIMRAEWTYTDLQDFADELGTDIARLTVLMAKKKGTCFSCRKPFVLNEEKNENGDDIFTWRCPNTEHCDTALAARLHVLKLSPVKLRDLSAEEFQDVCTRIKVSVTRLVEYVEKHVPRAKRPLDSHISSSNGNGSNGNSAFGDTLAAGAADDRDAALRRKLNIVDVPPPGEALNFLNVEEEYM